LKRREFLTALALLSAQLAACRSTSIAGAGSANSGHPRLLVSAADWASLAARRKVDPDLDRFTVLLIERARKDLNQPALERKLQGRRLLGVSREFIRRVLQWAFAYRVTGETAFLDRARKEMLAVAAFSDWNPSHYLDVAEMTAGLAIGYDWLFNDLPVSERATLRAAIIEKGIAQARNGHRTFRMNNNWNQVCIGGMVLGALAVQEDEPALARDLLAAAQKDLFSGLDAYAPDGVYPEGPGYWSYGTTYSVLLIAALRELKIPDWGVLAAPGFTRSAAFYAHSIGPSGKHFNFADNNERQELPSPIVFLARALGQPALLNAKREMIRKNEGVNERFAPLSILWWPVEASDKGEKGDKAPPLSFVGQGSQPLAIWRASWSDPNALWFAIKGGGAAHNHAHMDAGSFVLDWDGLRWAKDLGMQDYNSLESRGIALWNMKQDSPRWKVFRIGSDAHNTLSINGAPHSATGMASLRMTNEREALIDLAPVLGVKEATRRARFADDAVELEDRIEGAAPSSEIRWAMCSEAEIRIEGSSAILTQKGKTLRVRFKAEGVKLAVLDISQPRSDFDLPNPNTRQLIATAPVVADGSWRLAVRFSRE
jgi:oligo-alginate lyase